MPRRFAGLPIASILGLELPVATTRRARLLGLAHLDRELAGPGLLLPHCRSVHTFGMRFPIDVLFLDCEEALIERRSRVPPGRILRSRDAWAVAELV